MGAATKGRSVDSALESLRAGILKGRYAVGTRLPPERSLAEKLGINRLTLRSALSRLEGEGLVRPRQGSGIEVLDYTRTAGLELLRHLVQKRDWRLVESFLELRRVLGAEAVALAAERARPEQVERLRQLAELQATETGKRRFRDRDLEFGRAVIEAADNVAMLLLLNTVERVYRARPDVSGALHEDIDAVRASYFGVIALIESGDAEVARSTVRSTLEHIDAAAISRLRTPRRKDR